MIEATTFWRQVRSQQLNQHNPKNSTHHPPWPRLCSRVVGGGQQLSHAALQQHLQQQQSRVAGGCNLAACPQAEAGCLDADVVPPFKQSMASIIPAKKRPGRRTFWLFSGSE